MVNRSLALARRWFPERQFLLRSGERVRYIALPAWLQASALLVSLSVLAGVGGLAGAYHHLHKAIHQKEAEMSAAAARDSALADLRAQIAITDEQYSVMSAQFDEMHQQLDAVSTENDAMRDAIEAAEARAVALDKTRLALEERLHGAEQALTSKSGNVSQLSKQLADNRTELKDAEGARSALQKKLQQLQAEAAGANDRADQLKLALGSREHQLQSLAGERDRLRSQLSDATPPATAKAAPARGYGSELEQLIASTGVNLDKLLGRLGAAPEGQGGPFVALGPQRALDTRRDAELQSLVKSLPLAAPLDHYQIESGFGARSDPFRHRQAFHAGLDLSSAYRSPVLSTAPGTVTFTGVKDDYGRVVEIDHGHGIVTRYAHLHRILVALGQKVGVHQEIGELGSTGRSTGPHVHYEVLVDGTPLDPAKFMEAGKSVGQISTK